MPPRLLLMWHHLLSPRQSIPHAVTRCEDSRRPKFRETASQAVRRTPAPLALRLLPDSLLTVRGMPMTTMGSCSRSRGPAQNLPLSSAHVWARCGSPHADVAGSQTGHLRTERNAGAALSLKFARGR